MDQVKIGAFLKGLRNEKGMTQEQLAEVFRVSSRTISRWETGSCMPDISVLIELADYYEVDITEVINGERKSESMEKDMKETLMAVADYADKQKKQAIIRAAVLFGLELLCCGYTIGSAVLILKSNGQISPGYAIIPMILTFVFSLMLVINAKDYIGTNEKK